MRGEELPSLLDINRVDRIIAVLHAQLTIPIKQPRLSGVLPRCGRLHVDFRDLNLDEIANGDEAY